MTTTQDFLNGFESAGFDVGDDAIERLAAFYVNLADARESARGAYLKCLVRATQRELGVSPPTKPPQDEMKRTDPKERERQLAALADVGARMRAAVNRGIAAAKPALSAKERNEKSNYARTAERSLRRYIELDGDVRMLVPALVTKLSLANGLARLPKLSSGHLQARTAINGLLDRILMRAPALSESDRKRAVERILETAAKVADIDKTGTS